MKKTLIALAVAGVIAAPAAMAEVTLSGGLQAEVVSVGGDGNVVTGLYAMDGMQRNSLNVGSLAAATDPVTGNITGSKLTKQGGQNSGNYGFLKASAAEDLGGGMKALASYNFNIAVDQVLSTRDAFVGLSTGFGTVLAGRLSTPYKSATVNWDPFLATSLQARGNIGMSNLNNGYVNNAIAYANTFGGVKVVAAVVLDETAGTTDTSKTNGKNATSFSVNVPVGPVELALGYVNVSEFGDLAQLGLTSTSGKAAPKNASATKIGVKWNAGALTVAGQVEMLDKSLTLTDKAGNVVYVTGSYKLDDANTISAAYGMADKNANSSIFVGNSYTVTTNAGGIVTAITPSDKSGNYIALGANHAMSKTTSVFVGYSASDNGLKKTDASVAVNGKVSVISLGARVNF